MDKQITISHFHRPDCGKKETEITIIKKLAGEFYQDKTYRMNGAHQLEEDYILIYGSGGDSDLRLAFPKSRLKYLQHTLATIGEL